ncbi:MAG: phosphopentomutase, partial [Clostridia bacterium]|nr:phosphopentomutase [Clostridia bacterium]
MGKRVFLFVLDGFGVGECEDSYKFGDEGSNTFQNVNDIVPLKIPFLTSIGLKNIDGLKFEKVHALGTYGKLRELSQGKDTTTGHFEMMGIISKKAMPTFPNGFPDEIIEKLESAFGTKVLGNVVASGTQIIQELGEEHIKTGYPIVYTSADSVLQIAAHTDIVPLEKLYEYCAKAREIMCGDYAVGRVIARPFIGEINHFERNNEGRKDFSLIPDKNNSMKRIFDAGIDVVSVGKISEIFADQSITEKHLNHNNHDALIETKKIQQNLDKGFVF